MKWIKNGVLGWVTIFIASLVLMYLLGAIYFANHFFLNTVINGVNLSLKSHDAVVEIIKGFEKDYKLQLIERDGETEVIAGEEIGFRHNENYNLSKLCNIQNSFKWVICLFRRPEYYVEGLFIYNEEELENRINELKCLNKAVIEPQNVSFKYSNGSYEVIEEVYGNKIISDKLKKVIGMGISGGEIKQDLDKEGCYENPLYTTASPKTQETLNLLNRYAGAKITYIFGSEREVLDGSVINKWLRLDENLEVTIDKKATLEYVKFLSRKYDTVGVARKFKTSLGKTVEIKGGLYGWKISQISETKALLENIKHGDELEKEPIYAQRALPRGEDEIGNTYVEINITRQHLWFYKKGKLIAQGSIVTGNPNRGHSTKVGTFMLNYKDKGATLTGPGYEAEVTYWMPFYGNIGIHDATWRYSFGGEIYKKNGSHGCVNAPFYLAKKIFENIDEGTPIVCYEEEEM